MSQAYLNRLSVATPDHDVHAIFVEFADRIRKPRNPWFDGT
jgi:hypothetical protein